MNALPYVLPRTGRAVGLLAVAASGLFLLGGCASGPDAHVVSTPPPAAPTQVYVQQQPAQQQPAVIGTVPMSNTQGTIIVTQAPPAPPQDVVVTRTARPSNDHVWIEGHWTIRNNRYEWVPANWERAPYANARWIAPRLERRSDGTYVFYEAFWD